MGAFILGIGAILAALLLVAKKASGGVFYDFTDGTEETKVMPEPTWSGSLDSMISYAANKYNVDAALVRAVAMTESSLDPNAVNPSDPSYGLMQIQPILAEDFGIVKDYHNATEAEIAMIRDPLTNLRIGAWHLSRLLAKYPFDSAIQMYNVGERGFNEGRRAPEYLAKVKRYYDAYRNDSIG